MIMFSLPNLISLSRLPLAFLFLTDNLWIRCGALLCAMISDGLDGYLARKCHLSSQLGAIIDPLMDKFFVGFVLLILINEQKLSYMQATAMLSRDLAVLLFSAYLMFHGKLKNYRVAAIWSGKVTTTLQFFVLMAALFSMAIPESIFLLFLLLGFCALLELVFRRTSERKVAAQ